MKNRLAVIRHFSVAPDKIGHLKSYNDTTPHLILRLDARSRKKLVEAMKTAIDKAAYKNYGSQAEAALSALEKLAE